MSMIQLSEPQTKAEMQAAHLARKARLSPAAIVKPPTPPIPEAIAVAPNKITILHLTQDEYCHVLRMRETEAEPVILVRIQNHIKKIVRAVCDLYGLSEADMLSARRMITIARPRQIACYLCRTLTTKSLPEIGRHLGDRDHTTVLFASRRITNLRKQDRELNDELTWLEGQLAG